MNQLECIDQYVFLDTSKPDDQNQTSVLFTEPDDTLTYHLGDDLSVFYERLEAALNKGYYLAGWFAYEFLHTNEFARTKGQTPLVAELGMYREPQWFDQANNASIPGGSQQIHRSDQSYQLSNLTPGMQRDEYCRAIEAILEYIRAGDTYQVNYTFKFSFDFTGSIAGLYRDLRRSQPVPFGCAIKREDRHILSFSPELFFRVDNGTIKARPMKGTLKRGRFWEEDESNSKFLRNDVKNRSENVMIVDLLRNDLSRLVAETGGGTVTVDSLFDVEKYRTVLQMTSSITAARTKESRVTPAQMLSALFPCGSVTGAPKIRTMEIIDELEKEQRGVYTGAIGYFSPTGDAVFNVPIRTIAIDGTRGEMGIGSGIVSDSAPEDEWSECLLKARFLTNPLPEFELIETMFCDPATGILYESEHMERLMSSARYFNIRCEKYDILQTLHRYLRTVAPAQSYRIRLTLSLGGAVSITHTKCAPPRFLHLPDPSQKGQTLDDMEVVSIGLSEQSVVSHNSWLFHKTTQRDLYTKVHQEAVASGFFDSLFMNEREEITEGCISNVFIQHNGRFYTPPLTSGLLGGVMRRKLLESNSQVAVGEKVLTTDDLRAAEHIYLCNSVRGVLKAKLAEQSH